MSTHPADLPCSVHGDVCRVPAAQVVTAAGDVYTPGAHLGSGAFGRVYAATSPTAGAAALKVLSKCVLGTSPPARAALRAETSIQGALRHEHVVRLRAVVQDARRVYLVLDLVRGPSLADLLRARGRLPEASARTYFAYLCRALAYVHAAHVLHRDVKPANILVEEDLGSLRLCDFGLAQRTPDPGAPLPVVGTPNFLAPELVDAPQGGLRKHPDPRAVDAYAAGVVLYVMLVGAAPFEGADLPRTFRRIRAGRVSFPQGLRLSSAAKALVRGLLARNPASRPTLANALASPFLAPVPRVVLRAPQDKEKRAAEEEDARRRDDDRRRREDKARREDKPLPAPRQPRRASGVRGAAAALRADRAHDVRVKEERSPRARPRSLSLTRSLAGFQMLLHALDTGLALAGAKLESGDEAEDRFLSVARRVERGGPAEPIMVTRWLDMSERHGFATRMHDGRTGCCFNDASIMFTWSAQRDVPDVAYASAADRGALARSMAPRARSSCVGDSPGGSPSSGGLPSPGRRRRDSLGHAEIIRATFRASSTFRTDLTEKARVLCKLRDMLDDDGDENAPEDGGEAVQGVRGVSDRSLARRAIGDRNGDSMGEDGRGKASCSISFLGEDDAYRDPGCTESLLKVRGLHASSLVHVRGWQRYRSPRAVAFRLSNDTVHLKINVARAGEDDRAEEDYVMDAARQRIYYRGVDEDGWECNVSDVSDFCCSRRLHVRLTFCSRVLARFVSQQ